MKKRIKQIRKNRDDHKIMNIYLKEGVEDYEKNKYRKRNDRY